MGPKVPDLAHFEHNLNFQKRESFTFMCVSNPNLMKKIEMSNKPFLKT